MDLTVRIEIFPVDLDATVDFYTRVLRFTLVEDQRATNGYVSLRRGLVRIGAAARPAMPGVADHRRPPVGVEVVLEVDDVAAERDRVVAAGWPLDDDLARQPWGLTDFRLVDPSGHYLRVTDRRG